MLRHNVNGAGANFLPARQPASQLTPQMYVLTGRPEPPTDEVIDAFRWGRHYMYLAHHVSIASRMLEDCTQSNLLVLMIEAGSHVPASLRLTSEPEFRTWILGQLLRQYDHRWRRCTEADVPPSVQAMVGEWNLVRVALVNKWTTIWNESVKKPPEAMSNVVAPVLHHAVYMQGPCPTGRNEQFMMRNASVQNIPLTTDKFFHHWGFLPECWAITLPSTPQYTAATFFDGFVFPSLCRLHPIVNTEYAKYHRNIDEIRLQSANYLDDAPSGSEERDLTDQAKPAYGRYMRQLALLRMALVRLHMKLSSEYWIKGNANSLTAVLRYSIKDIVIAEGCPMPMWLQDEMLITHNSSRKQKSA
jgi:hypothetical protein